MSEKDFGLNYLEIPEQEKKNIARIRFLLDESARSMKRQLATEVVGGVIDKPWPRKDIDIACEFLDPKKEYEGLEEIVEAEMRLKDLESVVRKAVGRGSEFKIGNIIHPYHEHGYERDPARIAHTGSIEVKPKEGVPIELVNRVRY